MLQDGGKVLKYFLNGDYSDVVGVACVPSDVVVIFVGVLEEGALSPPLEVMMSLIPPSEVKQFFIDL